MIFSLYRIFQPYPTDPIDDSTDTNRTPIDASPKESKSKKDIIEDYEKPFEISTKYPSKTDESKNEAQQSPLNLNMQLQDRLIKVEIPKVPEIEPCHKSADQPKVLPRSSLSALTQENMHSVSKELNDRFTIALQKSQSESALKVENKTPKFTHRVLHDFTAGQYSASNELDEVEADTYLTVEKGQMVVSDGVKSGQWIIVTNQFGITGKIPHSIIESLETQF